MGLRLRYLIIREWDSSNNERLFTDGFQIEVNLSKRKLTPAATSLFSKGLFFCPTPRDIDIFVLRKDVSDYVRRLRLKEYFLNSDYVGGGFPSYPAFRHRSTWCPERNRDLILEAYISMLEKKIFLVILSPDVTETSAGKNRRHWKI